VIVTPPRQNYKKALQNSLIEILLDAAARNRRGCGACIGGMAACWSGNGIDHMNATLLAEWHPLSEIYLATPASAAVASDRKIYRSRPTLPDM